MNEINWFLAISNISCGILFIGVSLPLLKRKIKRNGLYGFRIPKAFDSEENWLTINAYGAKQLVIWSLPIILIGILCLFMPIDDQSALPMILGTGPVTLFPLIAIVKTLIYAKKI
jgi:hypothetical protein